MLDRVSVGLGHIGTRVNPKWSGVLCIAIHNFSEEAIRVNVIDVQNPIAYLAIEKLIYKTLTEANSDNPAILYVLRDVLRGQRHRNEIDDYFNHRQNSWIRDNTGLLKKLILESEEYKKLQVGIQDTLLSFLGSDEQVRWTALSAIAALLAVIISAIALFKPSSSYTSSLNMFLTQIKTQINPIVNSGTRR
ncbi:hypothetical protein [Trichormus azollae]|uniref:hypothetical protein n=1 Tax=Trichormus azollae TaxID=1164 RepID=UPI00325F6291